MKREKLIRRFGGLQKKLGPVLIGRGSRARPYIKNFENQHGLNVLLQFDLKEDNVQIHNV